MGTIVQEYGPIYGEAVNGTVSGRPNGSYYVPSHNIIEISLPNGSKFIKNKTSVKLALCDSSGSQVPASRGYAYVAQSQDLASYVQVQLYEDSDLTTLIGITNHAAGNFNGKFDTVTASSSYTIVDEQTYYLRAQLMNNGNAVATSSVIEIEGRA